VNTCRSWFVGSRSGRGAYIVVGEAGLIESVVSPQVIISDEIPSDVQEGISRGKPAFIVIYCFEGSISKY